MTGMLFIMREKNTYAFIFQDKNITFTHTDQKSCCLPSAKAITYLVIASGFPHLTTNQGLHIFSSVQALEKLGNSIRFYLIVFTRKVSTYHIIFPNSLSSDPSSQVEP